MLRALGFIPALLAVTGLGSSIAFATGSVPCGPADAHTLASNHVARVYVVRGATWGCSGKRDTLLSAGPRDIHERVGPVALAQSVAAYGATRSGVDTISAVVIVRRLSDGKQLRELPATTRPLGPEFVQSVDSVVVRTDSAVAWIASGSSIPRQGHRDVEVVKADIHGETRLDSGTAIEPKSLRLNGADVTWMHGTETRSAPLY